MYFVGNDSDNDMRAQTALNVTLMSDAMHNLQVCINSPIIISNDVANINALGILIKTLLSSSQNLHGNIFSKCTIEQTSFRIGKIYIPERFH